MGIHTLYLIRHGHYISDEDNDDQASLSEKGRTQSICVASAMKSTPIERVTSSVSRRSVETAEIIASKLELAVETTQDLKERLPAIPLEFAEYFATHLPQITPEVVAQNFAAAEHAFEKFFTHTETDYAEVLVSHGNLIQFFVCRVLNAPIESWVRLDTYHASITKIQISDNGAKVICVNDTGHLPIELRTLLNE